MSKHRIHWLRGAAVVLLLGVAMFSLLQVVNYWNDSRMADSAFKSMASRLRPQEEDITTPTHTNPPERRPETMVQLQLEYPNLVAWVTLEGTALDYPVMHTPQNPEYYLRRDMAGAYSLSGTPFLDARCTIASGQKIVYGHNMKAGTMFALLSDYKDETFRQQHPTFTWITTEGVYEYQVIAGLQSASNPSKNKFDWYEALDFPDQASFDGFVQGLAAESVFPLVTTPTYGADFLTLVTCDTRDQNKRFAVVAVLVETPEESSS